MASRVALELIALLFTVSAFFLALLPSANLRDAFHVACMFRLHVILDVYVCFLKCTSRTRRVVLSQTVPSMRRSKTSSLPDKRLSGGNTTAKLTRYTCGLTFSLDNG